MAELDHSESEKSHLEELHNSIEILNRGNVAKLSELKKSTARNYAINQHSKSPATGGLHQLKAAESEKSPAPVFHTPRKLASKMSSIAPDSTSSTKRKRRSFSPVKTSRKMRSVSPISLDVTRQCEESDLDAALDEKAAKKGLNVVNVKNLIKNILTHESVVRLVKNAMDGKPTSSEDVLEYAYRLTRSKTRTSCASSRAQSTLPPGSPLSTACLIAQEFSEDSSGEDYQPGEEEESDDESIMSPRTISNMGSPSTPSTSSTRSATKESGEGTPKTPQAETFKRPLALHKKALNFDEAEADKIGLRTRSRLHLKDTPLEQIEASFVPPDITVDMYDMECDDEDWKNFLREFALPSKFACNEVADDDEADPEYNILEDEEEPEEDREELRKDRAVQISKQEVQQLISELVHDLESSEDEAENEIHPTFPTFAASAPPPALNPVPPAPPPPSLEMAPLPLIATGMAAVESVPSPEKFNHPLPSDSSTAASPPIFSSYTIAVQNFQNSNCVLVPVMELRLEQPAPTWEHIEAERIFRLRLEEQLRKHVQLLTQVALISAQQPEFIQQTQECKQMLNSLETLVKNQTKPLQVCNLAEAHHLTETWSKHVQFHPDFRYRKQLEGKKFNTRTPLRMGLEFRKDLVTLMRQSRVFLYPDLLPFSPYFRLPENLPEASIGSPVEDQLLAMALERFHAQTEKMYRHWGVAVVKHELIKAIQVNYMPWLSLKKLEARIDRLRRPKIKQGNPVQYYFMYGKAPDLDRSIQHFDPYRRLQDVPGELLPPRWQGILGPTFSPTHKARKPLGTQTPTRLPWEKAKQPAKRSQSSAMDTKAKAKKSTSESILTPEKVLETTEPSMYTLCRTPEPTVSDVENDPHVNLLQSVSQVIPTSIGNVILSMPMLYTPQKASDTPLKVPLKLINSPVKRSPRKKNPPSPKKNSSSVVSPVKPATLPDGHTSRSETAPKKPKRYVMLKTTGPNTAIAGNVWVPPEYESCCIKSVEELKAKLGIEPVTSTPFKLALPRRFKQERVERDEASSDSEPETGIDKTVDSLRITESFHSNSERRIAEEVHSTRNDSCDGETRPMSTDISEIEHPVDHSTFVCGKQAANTNNENPSATEPPPASSNSAATTAGEAVSSQRKVAMGTGAGGDGERERDSSPLKKLPDDKIEKEETEKEREDDKTDSQADLAAFMQASVTIKPPKRSRGSKQQRKKLKEEKVTRGVIASIEAQSPEKVDADKGAFAEKYFRDVREALETTDPENYRRFVLTLAQVQHTGFNAVKVYEDLKDILKNHPLLLEEFVGFLTPLQAVQIGKQFEHFMITKMRDFFAKLQVQYSDNKNRLKKIVKTLSEIQAQPGVTVGQVKAAILPLLKGYPHLVDTFLQLFPQEAPPFNLLDCQDFEEIEMLESDKSGSSDFETITLPDTEDSYGTDKCPCSCHEVETKPRQNHCVQCTKIAESKASAHSGKSLKLVTIPTPKGSSSPSGSLKKSSPRRPVKSRTAKKK